MFLRKLFSTYLLLSTLFQHFLYIVQQIEGVPKAFAQATFTFFINEMLNIVKIINPTPHVEITVLLRFDARLPLLQFGLQIP